MSAKHAKQKNETDLQDDVGSDLSRFIERPWSPPVETAGEDTRGVMERNRDDLRKAVREMTENA